MALPRWAPWMASKDRFQGHWDPAVQPLHPSWLVTGLSGKGKALGERELFSLNKVPPFFPFITGHPWTPSCLLVRVAGTGERWPRMKENRSPHQSVLPMLTYHVSTNDNDRQFSEPGQKAGRPHWRLEP